MVADIIVAVVETVFVAVAWWLALKLIVIRELDSLFPVASFSHLLKLLLRYSFALFLSF